MLNYKENQDNENVMIQEQIKARNEICIDSSQEFLQDYNLIFDQISAYLLTNDLSNIEKSIHLLMDLNENAFTDQFFFNFEIPKLLIQCLDIELPKSLFNLLFNLISQILIKTNDIKLFNEFQKNNIIDIFQKFYMTDQYQIIESLNTFSYISSKYLSARNKILKKIDVQYYCAHDDQQISMASYQLIYNFCTFALPKENCDYIMTILQNGIISMQFFAFDLIFQSIYEISFKQEKNWYIILSSKHIDTFLLQYYNEPQFRLKILLILKRITELNLILQDSFLSLIFDFLEAALIRDEDDVLENENESIEIISEIFMICVKNNEFDFLLRFHIFDALILISEKGNFQSKANSIYCLTKLYHFFIKNEHDGSVNVILSSKIVDIFIQFLSLPQQDITLYVLISLINIISESISLGLIDQIFIDQNELYLLMNLENLLFNEDSLIVEKAQYLNDLIQSLISA